MNQRSTWVGLDERREDAVDRSVDVDLDARRVAVGRAEVVARHRRAALEVLGQRQHRAVPEVAYAGDVARPVCDRRAGSGGDGRAAGTGEPRAVGRASGRDRRAGSGGDGRAAGTGEPRAVGRASAVVVVLYILDPPEVSVMERARS
jgi:hypothetical protein